jgi:hypothetical protein
VAGWRVPVPESHTIELVGAFAGRGDLGAGTEDVVALLDPLGCDAACHRVPAMNDRADVGALVHAVRDILPTADDLGRFSWQECLAAMRDIGLFLGSIKRHGTEPVVAVPRLEPVLLGLARRTDMIARDTIHHYAQWNPTGVRQRMYTGQPAETILIDAVRTVLPPLSDAIEICGSLFERSPWEPEFAPLLAQLAGRIQYFTRSIADVVEHVTPEFFARVMRPYFEEITVSGEILLGPAAANIPLFLIDLAVWASDHGDPGYTRFMTESVRHTLPQWRTLLPLWSGRPSLVTRVTTTIRTHPVASPDTPLREATVALRATLQHLLTFRGRHIAIARRAYEEGVGLYPTGSGGEDISLLRSILDLTRQNRAVVGNAIPVTAPPL